ncbi:hypothetical protein BDK51DRAFT_30639, partial [Blyttiomyces helicus]
MHPHRPQDSTSRPSWSAANHLIRLIVDALLSLQSALLNAYLTYGETGALRSIPRMSTAHILDLFRATLGGNALSTSEAALAGIGIATADHSVAMLAACDALVSQWVQSDEERTDAVDVLIGLAETLSSELKSIWRNFAAQGSFLMTHHLEGLRAVWARTNYSVYCRHILSQDESPDNTALLDGIHARVSHDRLTHCPLLTDADPPPIPILFDITSRNPSRRLSYSSTTSSASSSPPRTSPLPIGRRARSFTSGLGGSILSSLDAMHAASSYASGTTPHRAQLGSLVGTGAGFARSIPDEEASVRGIAPPASVFSDRQSVVGGVPPPTNAHLHEIEVALGSAAHVLGNPVMSPDAGCHLLVFVHGLLGSAFDFRQYKNRIVHALYNFGIVNEEDTFGDIEALSSNLVEEIS